MERLHMGSKPDKKHTSEKLLMLIFWQKDDLKVPNTKESLRTGFPIDLSLAWPSLL